jgi:hypothetical protein
MAISAQPLRFGYWRGTHCSDGPILEPALGLHASLVGTALSSPSLVLREGEGDHEVRRYEFDLRVPTGRAGETAVVTFFDPHCPVHERRPRYLDEMRRDSLVRATVHNADLPALIDGRGDLVRPPEALLAIAVEVFEEVRE